MDYTNLDFTDKVFQDRIFHDIESLPNIFTEAFFIPNDDRVDYFYLIEGNDEETNEPLITSFIQGTEQNQKLVNYIKEVNPELKSASINFYNLNKPASILPWLLRLGYLNTNLMDQDGVNRFYYDKTNNRIKVHQNAIRNNQERNLIPLSLAPASDLLLDAMSILRKNDDLNFDDARHQIINENKHKFQITNTQNNVDFFANYSRYQYFGFNAKNYDLTMLALLNSHINQQMVAEYIQKITQAKDEIERLEVANEMNKKYQGKVFLGETELDTQLQDDVVTSMPRQMRFYNDELFKLKYMPSFLFNRRYRTANNIYRNWRLSGRYLDIVTAKISLKTLASALGRKVKESELLNNGDLITSHFGLHDLIAYNICDVLNTAAVFVTQDCQSEITKRTSLMQDYPMVFYQQDAKFKEGSKLSDEDKLYNLDKIDRKRLTLDDTSARYIERIAAPYKPLQDNQTVQLVFPKKLHNQDDYKVAKKHQQKLVKWVKEHIDDIINPILDKYAKHHENDKYRMDSRYTGTSLDDEFNKNHSGYDILDDTLYWCYQQDKQYPNAHILEEFAPVYAFYNAIRGHNVNSSIQHATANINPDLLSQYSKEWTDDLTRFYRNANGERTSAMALFKLGGIHGSEYNKDVLTTLQTLYQNQAELKPLINQQLDKMIETRQIKTKREAYEKNVKFVLPFLKEPINARHVLQTNGVVKSIHKPPSLVDNKGKIKDELKFTSNNITPFRRWRVFHIDFASYYPTLSVLMAIYSTFENGKEIDRFEKIYQRRLKIKQIFKRGKHEDGTPYTEAEKYDWELSADGLKLVINAGTGYADMDRDNNIRMNNNILAMRTIGQLFAWRIGQALALHGANIVSTNTDGLFIFVDPKDPNPDFAHNHDEVQNIVDDVIKEMFIGVDTEDLYQFVSKDTNNRVEIGEENGHKVIENAGGAHTTAWKRNPLNKSTDKPPLMDRVLTEYMLKDDLDLTQDFDTEYAKQILQRMIDDAKQADLNEENPKHVRNLLIRLGWTLNSTPGKRRFVYANVLKPTINMAYKPNSVGKNTLSNNISRKLNKYQPVFETDANGNQVPKIEVLQKNNRVFLVSPHNDDDIIHTINMVVHRLKQKNTKKPNLADNQNTFANYVMQRYLTPTEYQELTQNPYEEFSITKYSKMPNPTYANTAELPKWTKPQLMNVNELEDNQQMRLSDLKDKKSYINDVISNQPVRIVNESINDLTQEQRLDLINSLDLNAYINIVAMAYESWQNA